MSCRQWQAEISALLDAQLDMAAETLLQTHLNECSRCSAVYAEMRAAQDVFAKARRLTLEPPAHLWQRIEMGLQPQAGASLLTRLAAFLSAPRYGYATAVAMLVVSLLWVSQSQESAVRQSLAALDAYHLEVEGNPFFVQPSSPAGIGSNPFERK